MGKRCMKVLMLFILMIGVVACTENAQHPAEDQVSQTKRKQQTNIKMHAKDKELPQLKGGSERKNREINPVSNQLLQQKYPNTLVLRGSYGDHRVALTFDDGPDARFTPRILDTLKKHDVKATFFLMGSRAKALPKVTKRILDEGHAIGNHTYWHPKLFEESLDRVRWEVQATEDELNRIIGFRTALFRAPYGGLNEEIVETLADMDYSVVGWDVDSLDWMQLTKEEVQNNVLSNVRPGSIILMHSGGHWTQDLSGAVEALDEIITRLKKDGIEFVTVPELLNIREKK